MTWVSASRRIGVLGLALAFGLALSACGEKEESAGESMENAGKEAGAAMEKMGEKAGDMMEDAGKKAGEMMDEAPAEQPADGDSE